MKKWLFFLMVAFVVSCTSIDCPVNNVVATHYKVMSSTGDSLVMADSLSVITTRKDGSDVVLLNRLIGKASFSLPISYAYPEDELVFCYFKDDVFWLDTIWVVKDDIPHFESVDCNAAFFHHITSVRYTKNKIDSVVIKDRSVDYDKTKVHFYIYPKSGH